MKNIVAIEHECAAGSKVFDGSGILMQIINQTVLITCKHVLSGQSGCKHFFTYNKVRYEIDMNSDRYFGRFDNQPIPTELNGQYTGKLDDYAFYEVDLKLHEDLSIVKSETVALSDNLLLITHDTSTGKQISYPTKRFNLNPFVLIPEDKFEKKVRTTNMISIEPNRAVEGHSGGAVIRTSDNALVGMLQGGIRSRDSNIYQEAHAIISESIIRRYVQLKQPPIA